MSRRILAALLLGSTLLVAGCDHLSHPYTAAEAPSGKGVVYIYRPSKYAGSGGNFMIVASNAEERANDQGRNVGFIENGGYTTVFAEGSLRLTMPYGQSFVDLELEPDQSYFVRVEYLGGDERARLVVVPASEAEEEIADTKFQTNTWTGA